MQLLPLPYRLAAAAILMAAMPVCGRAQTTDDRWFTPLPHQWALQRLSLANRPAASAPWRTVVAEGASAPMKISWDVLLGKRTCAYADIVVLSMDHQRQFARIRSENTQDAIELAALPPGRYWLNLKLFDSNGLLTHFEQFYLNVLESTAAGTGAKPDGMVITQEDSQFSVSGLTSDDALVAFTLKTLDGTVIDSATLRATAPSVRWSTTRLEPGRSAILTVTLNTPAGRKDHEERMLARPGSFPPAPESKAIAPAMSLMDLRCGETVSAARPIETQRHGLDAMAHAMRARGSSVVQIWITWDQIELFSGACDWEILDSYVRYYTERNIPFVLASAGSMLFGRGPIETWGEWMLNHESNHALWRKLPAVSPSSEVYQRSARDFVARVIERYRGNPMLVGYCFTNQGMDSGIFTDHFDSITDYSLPARTAFRHFLRTRYASVDALNAAWQSSFASWEAVQPPLPRLKQEVDISQPWRDWTQWKLTALRNASVDLYDPVVRKLDPARAILHYSAFVGPFEYMLPETKSGLWIMADGGGEDYRMSRVDSICRNWSIPRQTESHHVPPENLNFMKDLMASSLRVGGTALRYNLVWNTLSTMHVDKYPKNQALQQTLQWWQAAAPVRDLLSTASPAEPTLGIVLSWSDQLYRRRVFRWYAMPGDRADALCQSQNLYPVRWLTELTPDSAWKNLKVILLPQDALILDSGIESRLARFVEEGGRLIVWGRAGQYNVNQQSFEWARHLGLRDADIAPLATLPGATMLYQDNAFQLAPAVEVMKIPASVGVSNDESRRPLLLEWQRGRGSVSWVLSDTPKESEKLLAAVLKQAGVRTEVTSSDSRVNAQILRRGADQYLLVTRYLGFHNKPADEGIETVISIPGKSPAQLEPVFPAGSVLTGDGLNQWRMIVPPSAFLVFKLNDAGAR